MFSINNISRINLIKKTQLVSCVASIWFAFFLMNPTIFSQPNARFSFKLDCPYNAIYYLIINLPDTLKGSEESTWQLKAMGFLTEIYTGNLNEFEFDNARFSLLLTLDDLGRLSAIQPVKSNPFPMEPNNGISYDYDALNGLREGINNYYSNIKPLEFLPTKSFMVKLIHYNRT